jgi:hypothetical protein
LNFSKDERLSGIQFRDEKLTPGLNHRLFQLKNAWLVGARIGELKNFAHPGTDISKKRKMTNFTQKG